MPDISRILKRLQRVARRLGEGVGRSSRLVRLARPVYQLVLQVLAGGRGIPWVINGQAFRIDPRFRSSLANLYEQEVAEYLRARVRPGDTCIDVGANVGAYVLQLARWSDPTGKIVAFEPGPGAAQVLERHVRMNGLTDRVVIVPSAVAAQPGSATLYTAGSDGMSRLDAVNPLLSRSARPVEVPVVTIDAYCESHGVVPQWMLIDVEGFEADVLLGARRTLESGSLRGIVAEFHPSVWQVPADAAGGIREVLEELRLTPRPLRGQRDLFAEHGPVALERT